MLLFSPPTLFCTLPAKNTSHLMAVFFLCPRLSCVAQHIVLDLQHTKSQYMCYAHRHCSGIPFSYETFLFITKAVVRISFSSFHYHCV